MNACARRCDGYGLGSADCATLRVSATASGGGRMSDRPLALGGGRFDMVHDETSRNVFHGLGANYDF